MVLHVLQSTPLGMMAADRRSSVYQRLDDGCLDAEVMLGPGEGRTQDQAAEFAVYIGEIET